MNRLRASLAAVLFLLAMVSTGVSAAPAIFNLVLDGTGSLSEADFRAEVNAAKEFVSKCYDRSRERPGERADWIMVNFFGAPHEYEGTKFINCSNLVEMLTLGVYLESKAHPKYGNTAIYNAIVGATNEVIRQYNQLPGQYMQVVIAITDGKDTSSTSEAKRSVASYYGGSNDQVFLFVVGVGDGKSALGEFSFADKTLPIDNFSGLQNGLFSLLNVLGSVR